MHLSPPSRTHLHSAHAQVLITLDEIISGNAMLNQHWDYYKRCDTFSSAVATFCGDLRSDLSSGPFFALLSKHTHTHTHALFGTHSALLVA
jgi:hypothetical protein